MLKEYLLNFGYENSDIEIIVNTYPLCRHKEETLYKNRKEKL